MIDLNTIESINHASPTDIATSEFVDRDILERIDNHVKRQYIELEDLGSDVLSQIEDKYKLIVYENFLSYVNDNYLSIYNIEDIDISKSKLLKIGNLVYKFIVVDFYNEILPDFLNKIKVFNIDDFVIYYTASLRNDASNFKTNLIKILISKVELLKNLENIHISVAKDARYKEILEKYGYFIELINFGDSNNFVENYFKRILEKYEDDITYRLL